MNSATIRARQLSLALLIIGVIDQGHLRSDFAGTRPTTSGLIRLGRDFVRRFGDKEYSESVGHAALTSVLRKRGEGR
jgi:hypothetical protein